jgi:hypothetical protein
MHTGLVERFTGHIVDEDSGELWLGVHWVGCTDDQDSTLPVAQLFADVPARVIAYLTDNSEEFAECGAELINLGVA